MDINSIMASQLASLQQTIQLSILDQTMENSTIAATKILENLPAQQPEASHPYKGLVIDLSV